MILDWKEYTDTVRQAAAEGCVLLKNEEEVLPLKSGEKIAVFGRIQRQIGRASCRERV